MTVDLVRQKQEFFEKAHQLLVAEKAYAAAYKVNESSLSKAEDWFNDPLFSPYAEEARQAAEFIKHQLGKTNGQRFYDFFSRAARSNPVQPGETRWQIEVKNNLPDSAADTTLFEAQWTAVEFIAFLQRASADLHAYSATPYSPLHNRARILTQRLWSAERGSDTRLAEDVSAWLKDFDTVVQQGPIGAQLDVATIEEFKRLPDPEFLMGLGEEMKPRPVPKLPQDPLTIDSGWLLAGRDKRFAAFFAPVYGTLLYVNAWGPEGKQPWEANFDELFPTQQRMPHQQEFQAWIDPLQDLRKTAQDLSRAGLMAIRQEVPVMLRGREQTAIVEQFHDFAHWYHATKSLDAFGLQFERLSPFLGHNALVNRVTDAYLHLAEAGYVSLDPQYFVHRATGVVQLAQIRSIFPMREFPYNFFIDSITASLTEKFGLHDERAEIRETVMHRVLQFLGDGRLPKGVIPGDLPQEIARRRTNNSFSSVGVDGEGESSASDESSAEAAAASLDGGQNSTALNAVNMDAPGSIANAPVIPASTAGVER